MDKDTMMESKEITQDLWSSGQLATAAGCSVNTVNAWRQRGLIQAIPTVLGYFYDPQEAGKLVEVVKSGRIGPKKTS